MQEGPFKVVSVNYICEGCKFLETEYWVEYPDGERDSGTSATCTAEPKRHISSYYGMSAMTPKWCPYLEKVND